MGPMDVHSLGYLRITAEDPHNWAGFAAHVLGMEAVPGDGDGINLRMDDRHHRIAIEPADRPGGSCYGWEVADAAALDAAAGELEAAGVPVTAATTAWPCSRSASRPCTTSWWSSTTSTMSAGVTTSCRPRGSRWPAPSAVTPTTG